jgi:hypothetical protein
MASRVRLFISGGPDQEPARELLGQALAAYPINVGWVIKRTPDVDSVAESHLLLLLFGVDITAPVGLELYWALRTEKPIWAYRSDVRRTPAGQFFVQEYASLDWRRYSDLPSLRRLVMIDLSRFLLAHAERYGVTLAEAQHLHVFLAAQEKLAMAVQETQALAPKPGGAAGGGVILAPGKDEPVGARLVGEQS